MSKTVSTSELKTHCSQVIDDVAQSRTPVVITKRGRPVARIVPLQEQPASLFGFARGSLTVVGDIVAPIDEVWEAAR